VWSRETLLAIRRNIESVQATLNASEIILMQNINAETGVRGYIVTNDPAFLEPYQFAQINMASGLNELEQKLKRQQAGTN